MEKQTERTPIRGRVLEWTYDRESSMDRRMLQRYNIFPSGDNELVELLISRQRVLLKLEQFKTKVRELDERRAVFLADFLNDLGGRRDNLGLYERLFDSYDQKVDSVIEKDYADSNSKHKAYTWRLAIANLFAITGEGNLARAHKRQERVLIDWRDRWMPRINEQPYPTELNPPSIV